MQITLPFGKLVLTLPGGQKQEFALAKAGVTLGRATNNDIVLSDAKVSRAHARLECGDAGCTLVDLGSANGTRLNGMRVERAALSPGDVITLGDSTLRFEIAAPRVEPDVTLIHSEAELDATLAQATLSMTLSDTHASRLAVHTPGKTWEVPLSQESLTVGRDPATDIVIDHPKVSRRHARLERRGEAFVIRDLGSTNGTWLGAQRVDEHTLQDGDTLRIGDAQLVFKRGFETQDLTLVDLPTPGEKRTRQPVVVVPALTGSELWQGDKLVWPNPRLLLTNPEIYRLPDSKPLRPGGIISEVVIVPNLIKLEAYSKLGDYLEEGLGYERRKDLFEFGYDWRQDVRLSAQRLAEAIEKWSIAPPITIIAHSLGCLVSRYYVECLGGDRKAGRLIVMGGPHSGTPGALSSLILGPNLLPFGLLGDRLRVVAATFPSAYQILPTYACVFDQDGKPIDILSDESWASEAQRPLLRNAREFWRELSNRPKVPTTSVFGYGIRTITRINIRRDAQMHWDKLELVTESSGDSAVTVRTAMMEGSDIHPVQQNHSALFVDNDVKMRLKLELTRR